MRERNKEPIIDKPKLKQFPEAFEKDKIYYTISKKLTMDPFIYNKIVSDFVKYCYENNLVQYGFDSFSAAFNDATEKNNFIAEINKEEALVLLSKIIRADRFKAGLIGSYLDNGYIQTIVKRLIELD